MSAFDEFVEQALEHARTTMEYDDYQDFLESSRDARKEQDRLRDAAREFAETVPTGTTLSGDAWKSYKKLLTLLEAK